MSLADLTTEELIALRNNDLSKIPTEKLQALRDAEVERSAGVKDEMHPDISFADRAIVKNFASNPESTIGYLKKQHPEMIFRNKNGEIQMRNKNESDYRVLDPSGFDLQDITDVGSDIAQGLAEGVVGSIPAVTTLSPTAVAASMAATGAATEGVKQGIGSMLGIPDNIDGTNMAISSVASGAAPLIAKGAKQAWNTTKNTIAPNVASYLSGIDKDIIKNINVDETARNFISDTGIERFLDSKSQGISSALETQKNNLGKALDRVVGKDVNIRPAQEKVLDMLRGQGGELTPFQQSEASKVVSHFDGLSGSSMTEMLGGNKAPINISPTQARSIRNSMYDFIGKEGVPYSQQKVAGEGYTAIKNAMQDSSSDKNAFKIANDNYADFMKKQNSNSYLNTFLDDAGRGNDESKKLEQMLLNNYKKYNSNQLADKHALDEANSFIKNAGGGDMSRLAREVNSYNIFNDPKVLPSSGWTGAKAGGIGSAAGGALAYFSQLGTAPAIGLTVAGGLGGEMAASPYVIKKVAQKSLATEKAIKDAANYLDNISPYIRPSAPKSIYNLLDGRED